MAKTKIALIADTQLYKRLYGLTETRGDWYAAFAKTTDTILAQADDIAAVLYLGDLLDTEAIGSDGAYAFLSNIQRLAASKIPLYMILGNHDRPERDGVNWISSATLVNPHVKEMLAGESYIVDAGKKISLTGFSYLKPQQLLTQLAQLTAPKEQVAEHWLCLHQALGELSHQQHSDLSATQVPTWVNRTFLGDFHDHLVHIDTKNRSFIYPGSIETVSFNQEKTPGFLIWDVPTAKYVHISTQQREYLTFKLTIETMDKWEEQLRKRMEESHQTFKKKPIVQIAYPAGTYIEYQRIKPLVEGSCLKLFDHEYALVAPVAKAEGEAVEIAPNASREDITRAAVEMLHQRPDDAVAQDAAAILANPDHVDTIRAGRYPKTVLRKSTQS